ncbi:putative high light inducible protein [Prochlorococcus marinus str. MIT 9123]|uniref:Putative high light inducible protein n=1 Tax=Prochlorococcus marinus str. MIT 9116 TaxID=167544 RepID=A0A0A1ZV80_PROMR|nr:chlorophyll a/b-binding protein [Prochlorococcus marinus]KGF93497.1 putative high light inducible protein [Prochlorococcus marinus str. MIT 9116]KGF94090.1 putative high light inducible protein [Prochlorococcus marinus str. MIT 9123]
MSPLSGFLAVIVFFTAILVAYLTKQFQNENLNYSSPNQMKNTNTNTNTKVKTIEKEKVVAETLNGRFAMLGLIAAVGAYLTTGQIIPGFV